MADYQSIYEGIRMDELWTLAGQAVQGVFVTTGGQEVELEKDENGKVHINIGYLSLFRYDEETNTIYAGDSDHPVNFAAFGEVTAAGIGGDTPTPGSLTLGGLVNVVAEADNPQTTDKVLVRRAGQSVTHWTLADLSSIAGAVAGVRINGVDKAPDANKIVDLGTGWATESYVGTNFLATTLKGANNGLAELGADGKVPSSQLPSYVDDVLEFATRSAFPATGESGKIYIALDTNKTYRWGGTEYVEISASLALGETESTAYRGDRGKIAYDHSQTTGNPHNTTLANIVGQTLADKLTALAGWFAEDENGNIYLTKNGTVDRSFWAYGEITAGGVGTGGGGGGGLIQTVYGYTDLGGTYSDSDKTNTFNAYTTARLAQRITALENAPAGGVTSLGGQTGAITVRGGQTANGSVNLAMSGTQLQASIVGLGSLAYQSDVATALGYTPYNAANIGSASVAYAGNSGTVGGYAASNLYKIYSTRSTASQSIDCNDITNAIQTDYRWINAAVNTIGGVMDITYSGDWRMQLFSRMSAACALYIRNRHSGTTWTEWKRIALTSDIPTNNNQLTNGAGYLTGITKAMVDAVGANADTLDGQHGSYFATASSLGNYLPLTGGTLTGSISVPTGGTSDQKGYWIDDCCVIRMATNTNLFISSKAESGRGIYFRPRGTTVSDGQMVLKYDGNLGIGTTSPSEKLHVAGNVLATGEVTAGSDMRWKHNITPVHNGIDAIMKLQPSEWEWNSDNHKGSGLIAQQVQSVLPRLVKTDREGYLHLTYDGLHAYEISAIQYHETEIDRLRRRVNELERQLNIN